MTFFINHLPPYLHLMIITRSIRPCHWRVGGRATNWSRSAPMNCAFCPPKRLASSMM